MDQWRIPDSDTQTVNFSEISETVNSLKTLFLSFHCDVKTKLVYFSSTLIIRRQLFDQCSQSGLVSVTRCREVCLPATRGRQTPTLLVYSYFLHLCFMCKFTSSFTHFCPHISYLHSNREHEEINEMRHPCSQVSF